jgi:D-sedoheptulose 7-phosphate isomerase
VQHAKHNIRMSAPQTMDDQAWLRGYFEQHRRLLVTDVILEQLEELKTLLIAIQAAGKKVIVAGNGGSAAIASHCAIDFTKAAGLRCLTLSDASMITCLANDYGYEHWLERALASHADAGDGVILISSSGQSKNMLHAARYAAANGMTVVTFTGFASDNPLRALGQLNCWVDSRVYNVVETLHQMWLLAVCDLMVATADPSVSASTLKANC